MKIFDKLQKLEAVVTADRDKVPPGTLGRDISMRAVEAITGGIKSDAWKTYMSLFADNKEQLERLTVEKPGEPFYLKRNRAYIVSNAVCDIGTTTNTAKRVTADIDADLANDATDESVIALRPFNIPGLD